MSLTDTTHSHQDCHAIFKKHIEIETKNIQEGRVIEGEVFKLYDPLGSSKEDMEKIVTDFQMSAC